MASFGYIIPCPFTLLHLLPTNWQNANSQGNRSAVAQAFYKTRNTGTQNNGTRTIGGTAEQLKITRETSGTPGTTKTKNSTGFRDSVLVFILHGCCQDVKNFEQIIQFGRRCERSSSELKSIIVILLHFYCQEAFIL